MRCSSSGLPSQRQRALELALQPALARQRLDLVQGAGGDSRQVEVGTGNLAPGVGARQEQEVGDQT